MPKKLWQILSEFDFDQHTRIKNGVYELRVQINKIKIDVSSANRDELKDKFIKDLVAKFGEPTEETPVANSKLCDYMSTWLETVKKPVLKPVSYKDYLNEFKTYIAPVFKNREIASIKGFELQAFFNKFTDKGKFRTAIKLYRLMSVVFDYAVLDDII